MLGNMQDIRLTTNIGTVSAEDENKKRHDKIRNR